MIRKERDEIIITLDNGKEASYNLTTGVCKGVSGRVVKSLSPNALCRIRQYAKANFWAYYLLNYNHRKDYNEYSESLYTIYKDRLTQEELIFLFKVTVAKYHLEETDKKRFFKIVEVLVNEHRDIFEEGSYYDAQKKLDQIEFELKFNLSNYNEEEKEFFAEFMSGDYFHYGSSVKEILEKDYKKILFRFSHEHWGYSSRPFNSNNYVLNFKIASDYLHEYVYLCKKLNIKCEYKNLFTEVVRLRYEFDLAKEKLSKSYQTDAPLKMEHDIFEIIVPTTSEEFQNEASSQRNCVFSIYFPKVKRMETHIVFIRRKDNIDKSFITCEIDNYGNIRQFLGFANKSVTVKDALDFQVEYQNWLKKQKW